MSNESDKHAYWANAIGFIAFFALLAFGFKCCTDERIAEEKTEQVKIIHGKK